MRVSKPKLKSEQQIQREILQALGTERTWKEPAKRKLKSGDVITYEKTQGDGLFVGDKCLFFRVNSGMGKSFTGGMLRLAPKGTADILGICHGIPTAIEVKTKVGKQSDEQKAWAKLWISKGGVYSVVRSIEEALDFVKQIELFAWSGKRVL